MMVDDGWWWLMMVAYDGCLYGYMVIWLIAYNNSRGLKTHPKVLDFVIVIVPAPQPASARDKFVGWDMLQHILLGLMMSTEIYSVT